MPIDCAFFGCSELTSVEWNAENCTEAGKDGHLIFLGCPKVEAVVIGDNVKTIPSKAFKACRKLTNIYISNIKSWCRITGLYNLIGCCGFRNKNLYINGEEITKLIIPDGVTSIGDSAFCNCSGLTSVTIPDSVASIGFSAFMGCSGLTSVTIPDSVTSIDDYAFYDCTGLTRVTIPESVTHIGYSFYGCSSLFTIDYNGTIEQWEKIDKEDYGDDYDNIREIHCIDGIIKIIKSKKCSKKVK